MASPPIKVAILGSCISRDNFNSRFNANYKPMWDCVLIQNQSSIISMMSDPVALEDDQYGEMSNYDKWNVRTDTNKEFLRLLVEREPAYLILDFFADIHFGCIQLPDGRYITNNRWKLWPTNYYKQLNEDGPLNQLRIEDDIDRYLQIWGEAYGRLVAYLKTNLPELKVIVHRGHNTETLRRPDRDEPVSLSKNRKLRKIDAARLNECWSTLDDHAIEHTGFDSIDLTGGSYPSFAGHPWGPFYVHYSLDYYDDFLAALNTIQLKDELAGPNQDRSHLMLEQIASSGESRARDELEHRAERIVRLRRRIKKQARRISALQSQTLLQVATRKLRRRTR